MELRSLDHALPRDIEVVALKGAAYQLQAIAMADGRLPGDVDLMVRRDDLDRAERALTSAGWETATTDAYDQRYYREWSHELPPMRRPGHALEIDLHHTITPVTSRLQPNQDLLRDGTRVVDGGRFRVLHPADQVIHAAVHVFQDSELADRLRDLVDFDGLVREHLTTDDAWDEFVRRTVAHGMERPVWYALRYGREWLGSPVPDSASLPAPSAFHAASVDWIVTRCVPPRLTGRPEPIGRRVARAAGTIRYHWLRMPPALLARHIVQKHVRRVLMPRR